MSKLIEIEGIGAFCAGVLSEKANLATVEQLLERGKDPDGREAIAAATGISAKVILRWVNMADLFRIKGVAEEYSDLLEASGVDTVVELARRNAGNLYKKMVEVNGEKALVRALPTDKDVADWVSQAKGLPRIVTH